MVWTRAKKVPGKISSTKAPEQTFEEVKYLKRLIDDQVPVRVKLSDNQEVEGTIEFYDATFIRDHPPVPAPICSSLSTTSSIFTSSADLGFLPRNCR